MQKVIQFKEEMLVDLFLSAGDSVSFAFQEPRSTLIEIRAEPAKQAGQRATAICTARLEWKASERVRLDFETLAKGNLPEGSTLPPSHAGMVDSKRQNKKWLPRSSFGLTRTHAVGISPSDNRATRLCGANHQDDQMANKPASGSQSNTGHAGFLLLDGWNQMDTAAKPNL